MKRLFIGILSCSLLLILVACTSNLDSGDCRDTTWGMSMEDVINAENAELSLQFDDRLAYSDEETFDLPATILFFFENDELVGGAYHFSVKHSDQNDYLIDFDNVKKQLIEHYGDPSTEQGYWLNERYKNEPENHGKAVAVGDISYFAEWETKSSNISLGLHGLKDHGIQLYLSYSPFD